MWSRQRLCTRAVIGALTTVGAAALATVGAPAVTPAGSQTSILLRFSRSVALRGDYDAIAADGPRVAAEPSGGCGPIPVWNVRSRRTVRVSGCRRTAPGYIQGENIWGIALAGKRLAWIRELDTEHGFNVDTELVVATPGTRQRQLGDAHEDYGALQGAHFAGLRGQGALLVASHVTEPTDFVGPNPRVPALFRLAASATDPAIRACPHEQGGNLIDEPRAAKLCVPLGAYESLAVDNGRILATNDDGSGYILSSTGKVIANLADELDTSEQAALTAGYVAILDRKQLEIDDAATGARLRTVTVSGGGLSAAAGLAVLVHPGRLVRLADGAEVAFHAPHEASGIAAALVPSGLFYLYARRGAKPERDRLGFVPIARLQAAFAGR